MKADEISNRNNRYPVSKFGEFVRGVSYKKEEAFFEAGPERVPIIRANNIMYDGSLTFDELVYVSHERISTKQKLKQNDIIIAMSSGSKKIVGKATQILTDWHGSCGAFCAVFRPKPNINPRYLGYFLQTSEYRNAISDLSAGTNINNLKQGYFDEISFTVPSQEKQKEIVDKLDTLLRQVRSTQERLDRIPGIIKRFRQSVLAAACSGKLTEDWRRNYGSNTQDSDDNIRCLAEENRGDIDYPATWKAKRISDIADCTGGYAFKSTRFVENSPYQVLRIGNIKPRAIDVSAAPVFICNEDATALERFKLVEGDLIISMTGTRYKRDYGFVGLINNAMKNLYLNQRLTRLRCDNNCHSNYLLYWMCTEHFRNHFFAQETGNVNQGNVGMDGVKLANVVLPPNTEQLEIIQRVETLFKFADKMEQRYLKAKAHTDKLTQSILAKAFRGEL